MVKHSSKSRQKEAAAVARDEGESSGDESTPPLAQPHRSSSGGKADSVVEVARKAKRKRSSRGSNKQRPVNFMPDIIRLFRSSAMDDVRSDCALKSSGSAFLNEFAAHRLEVLKADMDRTIMSRKQDTASTQDIISHVDLSMYGDPSMRKRAVRFVKKAVQRLKESLTKDEYQKYLKDKKAGKKVVWDKRSRSEKALEKKKAKEAAKAAAAEEAEDGPQPMEESDGEEEAKAAPRSSKSKKNKKQAAKAASDDEEEEEPDVPAKHLRSKNAKKASAAAEEEKEADAEEEEEEEQSDKEDDADADDGTDTANPNPSDSAAADAEDEGEAGASKGSDAEDDDEEEEEEEEEEEGSD